MPLTCWLISQTAIKWKVYNDKHTSHNNNNRKQSINRILNMQWIERKGAWFKVNKRKVKREREKIKDKRGKRKEKREKRGRWVNE